MTNDTPDETQIIPMPSRAELEADIQKGADWRSWGASGSTLDTSSLTPGQIRAALEAKLTIGPIHGDAFALEAWRQAKRVHEIDQERAQLAEKAAALRFDPSLGSTVPAYSDAERAEFHRRMEAGAAEAASLKGTYGREQLNRAMVEALKQRAAEHREAYIQSEAKKRVAAEELEQAIAARTKALAVRKAGGRTAGNSQ